MEHYFALPPLVDDIYLEKASQFGSANLCDGMKGLGIPNDGCMEASMLPVDENLSMVGTACTVETQDGDNFPIHVAIYQGKPGYVLVVDGKGYMGKAYMGDLMGGAAKAIGFEGVVVDGCVRDRLGLKAMQLPVFSKGIMPRGPGKTGPGKINTTIMCAGITVHPGDLVVGDCDGVAVVPRDRIEEVLQATQKKVSYEIDRRIAISKYEECRKNHTELPNLAPSWVTEMLSKQ
ncbi:RraA family protein [Sphaerochaeta sp. PS]|uniref:RraA family protein n=1 Tax=Sphaerochaeta sp. PS TaxID=3076336 RepID=UPI0028A47438|nr:RraA family protein [Sphaerochaeta sp. PS]MDT4762649.1 RraA family protein [Sphaerochaeta sp. PS]